jgi:hypothetical protein
MGGGVNQYAYVGNDPLNVTDPSGLCVKFSDGKVVCDAIDVVEQANDDNRSNGYSPNPSDRGGRPSAGPGGPGPGSTPQQGQPKGKPKSVRKNCKPGGFCLADHLRPPKPLNPAVGRCMIREGGHALEQAAAGAAVVLGANYAMGKPVQLQVPSLKDFFSIFVEDGGAVKTGAAGAAGGAAAFLVWKCRAGIY